MRPKELVPLFLAAVAALSLVAAGEHGGTTLVTPPLTHCLGLHRVTQFHLDIFSGFRERFDDPEGLFCVKLDQKDDPANPRDDDELTVYGLNSGRGDIIYNTSITSIRIFGSPGGGRLQFNRPLALAADPAGNLYVADTGNDRIVRLRYGDRGLAWIGEIRSGGETPLRRPAGIALSNGRLYVSDTGNDRIAVFDTSGSFERSFSCAAGGERLRLPAALAAVSGDDPWRYYRDEYLAVVDSLGGRLWKISPEGVALALARRAEIPDPGSFDHVAIDYYGNVYATDRRREVIHKFDRRLGYLAAIGGGRGAPSFDEPRGITISRRFGQVFVSERAGAQYFWIGTDLLRFEARDLAFDASARRCAVTVSFLLTEHADVTLRLEEAGGRRRVVLLENHTFPAGRFVRRVEAPCPDAASLAKCNWRARISARPTYSSRAYCSVDRESRLLAPQSLPALPVAPR